MFTPRGDDTIIYALNLRTYDIVTTNVPQRGKALALGGSCRTGIGGAAARSRTQGALSHWPPPGSPLVIYWGFLPPIIFAAILYVN